MIPEGITKNLLIINSTQVTNGATASASFDTRGFDYAVVNLFMTGGTAGARTAAATSVKVEQSDDDSAYVSASLTSGTDFTVATNGTATVSTADIPYYTFNIDTRGLRRYLKLTVVPSTTVGIQAVATLGRKSIGTLSVGSGSTDARNIVSV